MAGNPSPTKWRLLAGFAVLPFAQTLVAYLAFPLVWRLGDHGNFRPSDDNQDALAFAILTGLLGLLVTVVGAVPIAFTLLGRGPVSLGRLLWVGLMLGNAPFALYVVALIVPATFGHLAMGTMSQHLVPISSLVAGTLRVLEIGSTFGLMSAALFWLVAIRPDSGGASSS